MADTHIGPYVIPFKKAKLLTLLTPLRSVAGLCGKKWQEGPWPTAPGR